MMQVTAPLKALPPAVRTVGLEELGLEPVALVEIRKRLDGLARKLCRAPSCGVTVHCKAYERDGARKKYSVHVRYTAPGTLLVSGNMHDWNLKAAIRAAFRTLESRLQGLHEQHSQVLANRDRARKRS